MLVVTICLSLIFAPLTLSSPGDRSGLQKDCIWQCIVSVCNGSQNLSTFSANLGFPLLSFEEAVHWDCPSECNYRCMWSTVSQFRAVDFPVPQFYGKKMDYASAQAVIMISIIVLARRCINSTNANLLVASLVLALYSHHAWYYIFTNLAYGWNVTMGILLGVLNCIGWLAWSFYGVQAKQSYVVNCRLALICLAALMSLELIDRPPLYWFLDAHAAWHGSSVLLFIPWYRFVVADCKFLAAKSKLA